MSSGATVVPWLALEHGNGRIALMVSSSQDMQ